MELSKKQTDITKGVAILLMLLLHLFCTREYEGIFEPLIMSYILFLQWLWINDWLQE